MTTATPEIKLDADHKYWRGSIRVPGYSEILEAMGWPKNPFWTGDGREEGRALHEWLLFLAQGNEPSGEPDQRIAGRVDGIKRFFSDHAFEFHGGETPQYHAMGYCCTPDIWGRLDGKLAVIEAKRGAKMGRHKLQTAAQAEALAQGGFDVRYRFALYLKDGGYSLEQHDDEQDFHAWSSIVSAYNAREIYK